MLYRLKIQYKLTYIHKDVVRIIGTLVNMIKKGSENKPALLILLIFF